MSETVYGDYWLATLSYTLTGWPDQANVLGLMRDAALTSDFADDIATDIGAYWTAVKGGHADRYTLVDITIRDMIDADGAVFTRPVGVSGTDGGSLMPPDTAMVVSLHTGLGGKSNRGRVYLGGFCEGINDATGHVDAGSLSTWTDAWEDLIAALAGHGNALAVVSRFHDKAPRVASVQHPVTNATIDRRWDRQRRRARAA